METKMEFFGMLKGINLAALLITAQRSAPQRFSIQRLGASAPGTTKPITVGFVVLSLGHQPSAAPCDSPHRRAPRLDTTQRHLSKE